MKETIEAWAVFHGENGNEFFNRELEALTCQKLYGGTVVKLTGEMPLELRKVSTEVWISPCEPATNGDAIGIRIGYLFWSPKKTETCTIRARITMQELSDE